MAREGVSPPLLLRSCTGGRRLPVGKRRWGRQATGEPGGWLLLALQVGV